MSSKAKKAGGVAGLLAAAGLAIAVVATGLGLKLPAAPDAPITEGVILVQGFDPDANEWVFYIADCGGTLTADDFTDPTIPATFLTDCHNLTRIAVTAQVWSQYSLGDDYPSK